MVVRWADGSVAPKATDHPQTAVGEPVRVQRDRAGARVQPEHEVGAVVGEQVGALAERGLHPGGLHDDVGTPPVGPAAAAELGVPSSRVAVVGDIGADVGAAHAAGAVALLVPTPVTRVEEIQAAPVVAPDLVRAVAHLVHGPFGVAA
jgi:phosphoglycolate phosphatase-like HAD superfamily hydrolase